MKHAYIGIAVMVLGLVMIVGCFPVDESVDSTAPTRGAMLEKGSLIPTAIPALTNAELQEQIDQLTMEIKKLKLHRHAAPQVSTDNDCHRHRYEVDT